MKTRSRNILQITLVLFGLSLILLTYFLYPTINKKRSATLEGIKIEESNISDIKSNYFENVEYKALYRKDSKFTIKSTKAFITDNEPEIVHMTNMKVNIQMKDGRIVVITSDKGIYNKNTYDCCHEPS